MMNSKLSSIQDAQEGQLVPGACLSSRSSLYQIQSFIGEGAFGKVAKCIRMEDKKTIAIKMFKRDHRGRENANAEVAVLQILRCFNTEKSNIVQWHQAFTDRGQICIVFEHLDKSLQDFMKERYFRPLLLKEIRPIVQQLACALLYLQAAGIMHADLKLDNVMLVNHEQEPYRVKLIDFGLAQTVSTTGLGSYVQTPPYRAPEVMLGLRLTEAIDMWSLGCMAATLYLGTLLYPGMSQYDIMRYIVETQGQPPDHLLSHGCKTTYYFERDHTMSQWKLKDPKQYYNETGIWSKDTRCHKLKSLDDLQYIRLFICQSYADKAAEMCDVVLFVNLLKRMLQLDAAERITPSQVLNHHFISMQHIRAMYHLSHHVRTCFQMMEVCWRNKLTDSEKAAWGSVQQPSFSTFSLNKQSLPNHAGENSNSINTEHPCTSTFEDPHSTKSDHSQSIRSSMRKRMADWEDTEHHRSKTDRHDRSDRDRKRFKESPTQPSTSSYSSRTQNGVSLRVKRKKGHDASHSDHESKRARKHHTHRSTDGSSYNFTRTHRVPPVWRKDSAQQRRSSHSTHSQAQLERKRKTPDEEYLQPRKKPRYPLTEDRTTQRDAGRQTSSTNFEPVSSCSYW